MASREILPLSTLLLKAIAKKPNIYILSQEDDIHRLQKLYESFTNTHNSIIIKSSKKSIQDIIDFFQILIDTITEAGRLTDEVFPVKYFEIFGNANTLCLRNTKLSGKYIRSIIDICPHLSYIDVTGSFQVDDETITYMLTNLKNIETLKLRDCRKITSKTLLSIQQANKILKNLDIGGNINIDVTSIHNFLLNYQHIAILHSFHVSGLRFNDLSLTTYMKVLASPSIIREIGMAYADVSSAVFRKFLLTIGSSLEYLNISWLSTTVGIANKPVQGALISQYIIESCLNLQELDICGHNSFSVSDIISMIDGLNQKVRHKF